MPLEHKPSSLMQLGMDVFGNVQPSCSQALALARRGIDRSLGRFEGLSLRYHAQLCPLCGCKREVFVELMRQKHEAETARGAPGRNK